jgi:hypothetical protein
VTDKSLIFSLLIAFGIGYGVHWSVGLIIAMSVIHHVVKSPSHIPDQTDSPQEKKPFLAHFGDIFKMPKCWETKKEVMAELCDIVANGNFDHEVVGEASYRLAIWSCIPPEHANADKFRLYFIATLVQENDNEHDKNAVAVKLNKGTVGYIPRTEARRFRKWAAQQQIDQKATCRAVVVGNKDKHYSIWLDLPM